ncbi:MAG: Tagatose-bisphosphate aldolase [Candidatus Doudnabacteria bacterium]|nr:Tagatose-bisphosphate aldolase [Candidatus Doudnabacteria bacterium]
MNLKEALEKAQQDKVAIGHFNISDLAGLKGIANAARELKVPVIIGLSEGERAFVGLNEAAALVKSIREGYSQEIFINADHTHSLESAIAAAKAGFDSIVYDRSDLPFEENIKDTANAVIELKKINPSIIIEGEIGNIGTGSEIHEKAPENIGLSTPEEAARFVKETGVDVLAPAVGNMHGLLASMVSGEVKKRLHLDVIESIKSATGLYLTLHGASGTNDEDMQKAIQAGITIIHINTEIRIAWRKGLDAALLAHPDELAPSKIFPGVVQSVQDVVKARLQLFNRM